MADKDYSRPFRPTPPRDLGGMDEMRIEPASLEEETTVTRREEASKAPASPPEPAAGLPATSVHITPPMHLPRYSATVVGLTFALGAVFGLLASMIWTHLVSPEPIPDAAPRTGQGTALTSPGGRTTAGSAERIRELEAQLAEMRDALSMVMESETGAEDVPGPPPALPEFADPGNLVAIVEAMSEAASVPDWPAFRRQEQLLVAWAAASPGDLGDMFELLGEPAHRTALSSVRFTPFVQAVDPPGRFLEAASAYFLELATGRVSVNTVQLAFQRLDELAGAFGHALEDHELLQVYVLLGPAQDVPVRRLTARYLVEHYAERPYAFEQVVSAFDRERNLDIRRDIVRGLKEVDTPAASSFLESLFSRDTENGILAILLEPGWFHAHVNPGNRAQRLDVLGALLRPPLDDEMLLPAIENVAMIGTHDPEGAAGLLESVTAGLPAAHRDVIDRLVLRLRSDAGLAPAEIDQILAPISR